MKPLSLLLFVVSLLVFNSCGERTLRVLPAQLNSKHFEVDRPEVDLRFPYLGQLAVPVDFLNYRLQLSFDVEKKKVSGKATLSFRALHKGYPFFDMVNDPKKIRFNGKPIQPSQFQEVETPDKETTVRVLSQLVERNQIYDIEIDYDLARHVSFDPDAVRFFSLSMDDGQRGGRAYLERRAVGNLEFDQFPSEIVVSVKEASIDQKLFSNGAAKRTGENTWKITFPEYFNSSGHFLILTNFDLNVYRFEYPGLEKPIPIEIFSKELGVAQSSISRIFELIAEFERDYGAFAHERFVAHVYSRFGHMGMEYAGATSTTLDALKHEIFHSWFARGVLPKNGNAQYIDEGLARWMERGYESSPKVASGSQLSNFGRFRRHTIPASYAKGRDFFRLLSHKMGGHGSQNLKKALGHIYRKYARKTISSKEFLDELERGSGIDIDDLVGHFIHGEEVPMGRLTDSGS